MHFCFCLTLLKLVYGYNCKCRTGYRGNPYILGGCKPDNGYNPSQPKSNCTRRCGSINVTFPFGLEKGCFAREQFHLHCTNKTSSALLYWSMNNYQVTNISVEQGLIEYINPDANAQTDFGALDGPSLFLSSAAAISMQWVVAQLSREEARHNMSGYACASANSECKTIRHTGGYVGYRCNCISGYQGNPYIESGCVGMFSPPS